MREYREQTDEFSRELLSLVGVKSELERHKPHNSPENLRKYQEMSLRVWRTKWEYSLSKALNMSNVCRMNVGFMSDERY